MGTRLLEGGYKCFELVKGYDFVKEWHFASLEDLNDLVMYQKPSNRVTNCEQQVNVNTESETQALSAPFGKKTDFNSKESLYEKLSPVIVMYERIGLGMETLGWTQWHKLTALMKLN